MILSHTLFNAHVVELAYKNKDIQQKMKKYFVMNIISCFGPFKFGISSIDSCTVPFHLLYFILAEFLP